jgi:hypothetical protein
MAIDGSNATYSSTAAQRDPWWALDLRRQVKVSAGEGAQRQQWLNPSYLVGAHRWTQKNLPASIPPARPAVIITLRRDAQYKLASLHDLEVRAGATAPSASSDPAAANVRCALRAGQLGTTGGQRLTLACPAKLTARYMTLQIRWVGWGVLLVAATVA